MLPASVESSPQFWQMDNKMYFDITLKNIDINNRNDRVKIKTYLTGQSITNPSPIIICHPFPKIQPIPYEIFLEMHCSGNPTLFIEKHQPIGLGIA
jgi:hypothetical protein